MIVGSLYVTAGAIIIGVPIGILTAVFMAFLLSESRSIRPLKMATELLAGIPSVVYGFFGLVVLVPWVREHRTKSSLRGRQRKQYDRLHPFCLGMMILPTIIGLTESALRAVPTQYYEGAVALGGTHERGNLYSCTSGSKIWCGRSNRSWNRTCDRRDHGCDHGSR